MPLTPQDFVSKWKRVAACEKQTHQEHFLDLCHLVGHPTPNEYDHSHATGEQAGVSYGYGFHIIDDGKHGRLIGYGGRAMGGYPFLRLVLNMSDVPFPNLFLPGCTPKGHTTPAPAGGAGENRPSA